MDESGRSSKPKLPTLPEPIPDFLDVEAYLLEIEERSNAILEKIKMMSGSGGSLTLFDLVTERNWLEVVRVFMILLFLAQSNEIDLRQDEDESYIRITFSR